jgi:CheY-like chemotaxis protein
MADPLSQLRILIVDDNKQMRTIIGTCLAAAGVRELHYADDGRTALESMNESPVDCVYVDFEMPGMNGLDYVSRVRAMETGERFLPIIMITGYSDMAHLSLARDRGVTEFLRKPVTARDILMRLEAVILRPRAFVTTEAYFGPDRRRRRQTAYLGVRRRQGDRKELVEL